MPDETRLDTIARAVAGLVREAFMVLALAGVLVITVVTAWLAAS